MSSFAGVPAGAASAWSGNTALFGERHLTPGFEDLSSLT
jgi:hypothetical protein